MQHKFIWSQIICGICIHGYKEEFCRGKIPITNQQKRAMRKTGCSAFEITPTEITYMGEKVITEA